MHKSNKHWSNKLSPMIQPAETCMNRCVGEYDEQKWPRRKFFEAAQSFRAILMSPDARDLVRDEALALLDARLFEFGKVLFPYIKQFYPDGLREYPELEEVFKEAA